MGVGESTPKLKIVSYEEQLSADAIGLIEEALTAASDPEQKIEGCAVLLFRANKTYSTWWSSQVKTVEKIGYLEVMKLQLALADDGEVEP